MGALSERRITGAPRVGEIADHFVDFLHVLRDLFAIQSPFWKAVVHVREIDERERRVVFLFV